MYTEKLDKEREEYKYLTNELFDSKYELKLKYTDQKYKPTYQSKEAAFADLFVKGNYNIKPFELKVIDTGIILENLNSNYYLSIVSRSSTFIKKLIVNNGIVDSDYRGVIYIIVINISNENYQLKDLDRIAQITVNRLEKIKQFNFLDHERDNNNDKFNDIFKQADDNIEISENEILLYSDLVEDTTNLNDHPDMEKMIKHEHLDNIKNENHIDHVIIENENHDNNSLKCGTYDPSLLNYLKSKHLEYELKEYNNKINFWNNDDNIIEHYFINIQKNDHHKRKNDDDDNNDQLKLDNDKNDVQQTINKRQYKKKRKTGK
jgi:dUTP pyrophosphatase